MAGMSGDGKGGIIRRERGFEKLLVRSHSHSHLLSFLSLLQFPQPNPQNRILEPEIEFFSSSKLME